MTQLYHHGSLIFVVRACYNDNAKDLVALAGEHSVDVLQVSPGAHKRIASFHIGAAITALAWSPRTISSSVSDRWFLELAVADIEFNLHLLTKSCDKQEEMYDFGGGLSGHHGKVTDMEFCGGDSEDSVRFVATVSDDMLMIIWNLRPTVDVGSTPAPDGEAATPGERSLRACSSQSFPYPLTAVVSHPSSSKEFLVADNHGSIFLIDWRAAVAEEDEASGRKTSLLEFVSPRAVADTLSGKSTPGSGSISWRRDAINIIGAVYGSIFSIWDIEKMQGGKPEWSGSFPEGGQHFRWCPNYPGFFAISSRSHTKGACIHICNLRYIHAQPVVVNLAPPPHIVRDFDFIRTHGTTMAAAVGRNLIIFEINIES